MITVNQAHHALIARLALVLCLVVAALGLGGVRGAYALPANPTVSGEAIEANWNSLDDEHKKIAQDVVSAAQAQGFSKEAAAAIAGNFWRESGFSLDAQNPSSGACGLYQALGSRRTSLLAKNGVNSCSGLKADKTMEAAIEDGRLEWVGWKTTASIYPSMAQYALTDADKYGVKGAAVPSGEDKFDNVDAFKKTDNWYFATWIWMTNWEAPGGAEAGFMKRVSYTATILKKVNGGSVSSSSKSAASSDGAGGGIKDDWELPGMPKKPSITEGQAVSLAEGSQLSQQQKDNLYDILAQRELESQSARDRTVAVGCSVFGILLIVWAVMQFAGLAVSLVSPQLHAYRLVMLGNLEYAPTPEEATSDKYVTLKGAIGIAVATLIMAALLLTAALQDAITSLLSYFIS